MKDMVKTAVTCEDSRLIGALRKAGADEVILALENGCFSALKPFAADEIIALSTRVHAEGMTLSVLMNRLFPQDEAASFQNQMIWLLNEGIDHIIVAVPRGETLFTALNHAGVFVTLDNMETDAYHFRDLATKPLSAFANEKEFSDDAWELLDTQVTADMTVYAGFYKKIGNLTLTLTPPVAGRTVTVTEHDDIYTQNPSPAVTLADDAHCTVCEGSAVWYAEGDEGSLFEGTFEKDKTYFAEMLITSDFGYWLDENTTITADGAEVVASYGRMTLFVKLSASPVEPSLGDANGDGKVDIRDVTAIQRHLANLEPIPEQLLLPADTNGDGVVDIKDATHLQMFLAEFEGVVLGG